MSDSGSHNLLMVEHELHEEEIESSWEAAPAIALVIAGQVVLAIVSRTQDWTLWGFPWWVWLIRSGPRSYCCFRLPCAALASAWSSWAAAAWWHSRCSD
jgi:hypothetical protein